MCSENMTQMPAGQLPKYLYHLGNLGCQMPRQCQNFDWNLQNGSDCACALQIKPKQPNMTAATSGGLQVAMHRSCHIFSSYCTVVVLLLLQL